jgi:hypothetical protein
VFSSGPEPHESNLVAVRADTTVTWLGQPSMSDR